MAGIRIIKSIATIALLAIIFALSGCAATSQQNLGRLIIEGRYDEAKADCASRAGDDRAYCFLNLANAYYAAGDYENAAQSFEEIEDSDKYAGLAGNIYSRLAETHFEKGEYETAVVFYRRAKDDRGLRKIADTYFAQKKYDQAAVYYSALDDRKSLTRIAEIYFEDGKYDAAAKYFQMAHNMAGLSKVADTYFAQKSYDKAATYYLAAGYSDVYGKIADAALGDKNYKAAEQYFRKAATRALLTDDFEDNRNGWIAVEDSPLRRRIEDGMLLLEYRKFDGRWTAVPSSPVPIDPGANFKIEATAVKVWGGDEAVFSLLWGLSDADNYLAFEIDGDGNYQYGKMDDGQWTSAVEWTQAPESFVKDEWNTFSIKKEANQYHFYVNQQLLTSVPLENGEGSFIGFGGGKRIRLAVDRLSVTQLPNNQAIQLRIAEVSAGNKDYDIAAQYLIASGYQEKDAFLEIAGASHTQGDLAVTERYLMRYGFSEGEAYLNIADQSLKRGDFPTAAAYLAKAGWPLDQIRVEVVIEDDFSKNRLNWVEGENDDAVRLVYNGYYYLEQKRKKGTMFSWPRNPVIMDQNKDFLVEAAVAKVDGVDDNSFDVFWGLKDIRDCYSFGINGDGYYRYTKIADGQLQTIVNWTPSPNIVKHNSANTISVVKEGHTLKFFINHRFVTTAPFEPFFGSKVGFIINDNIHLQVDSMKVYSFPPERILVLAANYFGAVNDKDGLKRVGEIYHLKKEWLKGSKLFKAAGYQPIQGFTLPMQQ